MNASQSVKWTSGQASIAQYWKGSMRRGRPGTVGRGPVDSPDVVSGDAAGRELDGHGALVGERGIGDGAAEAGLNVIYRTPDRGASRAPPRGPRVGDEPAKPAR